LRVLKTLHRAEDPERRARMHREVASLETLDHAGIPKVIESNASDYRSTMPLYIIMEHIPGCTLENRVKDHGSLGIEDALLMTIALLEAVGACHGANVVHRDIKPDNVVLRDGDTRKPVLIDFGLSFNQEQISDGVTTTEHQVGNRFLSLPELHTPAANKRDFRSDIAACAGVLIYALTGCQPMQLVDGEGRKPHQRERERAILESLPISHRGKLRRLFDQAFEIHVDRRFQSAEALVSALREALAGDEVSDARASLARELLRIAANPGASSVARIRETIVETLACIDAAQVEILGQFEGLVPINEAYSIERLEGAVRRGFHLKIDPDVRFAPEFHVVVTGDEVVLLAEKLEGAGEVELHRAPLASPAIADAQAKANAFLQAGIARVLTDAY
jgi:serine/threonine-protein kinase